jgi:hypothetical protein
LHRRYNRQRSSRRASKRTTTALHRRYNRQRSSRRASKRTTTTKTTTKTLRVYE